MSLRKERMGDEIRDIIAASLTGGQMNDPRLQFVTITGVKLSPDLQLASVHFRVIDEKTQSETRKALDNAAGIFRTKLAKALEVRRVPALRFYFDTSVERGASVDSMLDLIRKERND
ncbi:MAG: 30S ribosome-binding factor RbfA [Pseudomonadota bacterium]